MHRPAMAVAAAMVFSASEAVVVVAYPTSEEETLETFLLLPVTTAGICERFALGPLLEVLRAAVGVGRRMELMRDTFAACVAVGWVVRGGKCRTSCSGREVIAKMYSSHKAPRHCTVSVPTFLPGRALSPSPPHSHRSTLAHAAADIMTSLAALAPPGPATAARGSRRHQSTRTRAFQPSPRQQKSKFQIRASGGESDPSPGSDADAASPADATTTGNNNYGGPNWSADSQSIAPPSPRRVVLGVLATGGLALGGNFLGITGNLLNDHPDVAESSRLDVIYPVNGGDGGAKPKEKLLHL